MKVWVVLEEDRGMGVDVIGVYASQEEALRVEKESTRYSIRESELTSNKPKRHKDWV
jgi:hypothetical protein